MAPRFVAGLLSTILGAGALVFAASVPAAAESSPAPTTIRGANTVYAYVGPGENLDVSFRFAEAASSAGAGSTTITLRGPGATLETCTRPAVEIVNGACSFLNRTSASPGVWRIDFSPDSASGDPLNRYEWDISVQNGSTDVPGRVYSERYSMGQRAEQTTDFSLWYVGEQGYQYQADYAGYNGVDSVFSSDATGVAELNTCVSAYESMDRGGPDGDTDRLWTPPHGSCGDPYKIFFDAPSASLPATATLWDGSTTWLQPEVVLPEISGLTFTRDSATTSAGTFSFNTTNFVGQLEVLVDANNDGDYSDPEDRRIPASVAQDGTTTVAFDGLNGLGVPIPSGMPMGARAAITQTGEIHFTNQDVETRTSLSVQALNGPDAGSRTLYWDDSDLVVGARDCTTPQPDGTAGVDSSGGVHGWVCPNISGANANDGINGSWGDFRNIDDWTYQSANAAVEIEISQLPMPMFVCSPSMPGLLIQGPLGGPSDLYTVDLVTGTYGQVATGIINDGNALAYNPTDDYYYAFSMSPTKEVYRIGSDYQAQLLGLPSNWQTFPGMPASLLNMTERTGPAVGTFDANGHYWITGAPGEWAEIDMDPASATFFQVVAAGTTAPPANYPQMTDWAYNELDGNLYAIAGNPATSPVQFAVVKFDTATQTLSVVAELGGLQNPDGIDAVLFGAAYTDANGFLYSGDNTTGGIWRTDMATGETQFFAAGPAAQNNDGARCASAPIPIDFGDAPAGFGTVLADDGPRHSVPGYDAATNTAPVMLGASIDIETDGQPSAAADGDGADEDGVVFNPGSGYAVPTLVTGMSDPVAQQPVWNTLRVTASTAGYVSVWVDWNLDGDFLDAGEQVANAQAVAAGSNNVSFTQGTNPSGTQTYVRVRYSTDAAAIASPTGAAPDGEVEDYQVQVDRVVHDFGDAPDAYRTTLGTNGAGHAIIPGLMIGASIDDEADGQPSDLADGDDGNGVADEDGVAAPIVVTVGDQTTVVITATNTTSEDAFLAGWIDLNGNGVFDPSEVNNASVVVPANSGTASYTLVFPAGTVTADTFARFRLAPAQGDIIMVEPVGHLYGGEVEDYPVTVVERALEIEKTSDATEDSRPGDVVTYTVTATNTGTADYTDVFPAVVVDDLSGALDDATYNGDAAASVGGAPGYAAPLISWSGALAAGASVSVTYTVTLVAGGDGVVRNVAFASPCDPADAECVPPPVKCDPPTAEGLDPETGVPCAEVEFLLPRLAHTKVADTTELPADGGVVTYTVTVTNEGPGVFTDAEPGVFSDDLSNVLDDGTFNGDAVASNGSVVFDATADRLDWSGALGVGESATIRYSVTYDSASGDNVLLNVACVPVELAADPTDPCRSVEIPGAKLQDRKTSNPVSGSSVVSGQEVTYTLHFENTGKAPATVDTFDEMVEVLDDATLTAGPTTSDPALTATVSGTRVEITGTVPVGATYTVSYTVVVNAFEGQGNHVLGNVLGECLPFDPTCRTEHRVPHTTVTKTSDAVAGVTTGDTVSYTVTVTNDGEADYTAEDPARAEDDLTGVLDDAVYNGDAAATAGTVSFTEPMLNWSGPLAVGASESFTYTVTVSNAGDHVLENVAGPVCELPEVCGPPVKVITLLPKVVPSKVSDPVSGSDVAAGDVVTYTLSWENVGKATGKVDATDDLSRVLDDGVVSSEPVSSDPAVTVVRTGDQIRVTGPIEVGQTITVMYQVTIKADGDRGDNIAGNVLTPDVPPCLVAAECPPPTTEHFIGELDDWKTVDPASGSTVQAGQEMTYTLHFENTGEASVAVNRDDVLTQVVDDATIMAAPTSSDPVLTVSAIADGRFTVSGLLTQGQVVTVSYTVTVNQDGQRGDDRLGNFLVEPGMQPPVECVPVDQQRPDCTINHVSNVVPSKSADPESGTKVSQGQRVTYTLTFTNVSTNPDSAAAAVEYTDHLSDVLDDAAVTSGPVVSAAGVTAVKDGELILVTGTVEQGETVTVSYTVTVHAYDQQGNHHLGNVLAVTGHEPVCVEGSGLCTSHDIVKPSPLAHTGATNAWDTVLAALVLLLAGGGAVLISRQRRQEATR